MKFIFNEGNLGYTRAINAAVAQARDRQGPTLIVANTDRLCGAYEGDPQFYRTKDDVTQLERLGISAISPVFWRNQPPCTEGAI